MFLQSTNLESTEARDRSTKQSFIFIEHIAAFVQSNNVCLRVVVFNGVAFVGENVARDQSTQRGQAEED